MPPKFQSSFIPKGPVSASSGVIPEMVVGGRHDLFGFVVKAVFVLSILLAVGVLGYKWYLGYSIRQMGAELERTRAALATDVTGELIRLNDRIVSTTSLLEKHRVLSPLFTFLETSTPKSVRFTEFTFASDEKGPEVIMRGEAGSYAALALEANTIYRNKDFKNPVFSDIRLDEKGNVTFSLRAQISPDFLSYQKRVGRAAASVEPLRLATSTPAVATSTAKAATSTLSSSTSTPKAATSTPR